MNWIWIVIVSYLLVLVIVCLRIIFETRSSTKTLAYLLLCVFMPVLGILFYLTFGINYWRAKLYSKKSGRNDELLEELNRSIPHFSSAIAGEGIVSTLKYGELARMIDKQIKSPLTRYNKVKLFLNGEEKFPELLQCIEAAKHHIHVEYYIYEQDEIGCRIIDLLVKKAREGVAVRFIYDDFGSPTINKKIEKRMKAAGIEVFPFHKVLFYLLANRINYRNHRKIVVVDGKTGFTGGINVCDKYINNGKQKLFWRDTHLRIDGPGVYYLQYLFLADWNFCCAGIKATEQLHFPEMEQQASDSLVQIVASGPDSMQPTVLHSILQGIYLAEKEILITTPYFIPDDNIIDALRIAATSGLSVKLLAPGKSDSRIVNAASKANYSDLLLAGVDIYLYQKGFVHAKSMVIDGKLAVVGTANMDYRSFELNFEVNAIIYETAFADKLRNVFFDDLEDAVKIDADKWLQRPLINRFSDRVARLFSHAL